MNSICIISQSCYDIDARVRRKAEALIAAGYSVDVLGLSPPNGKKRYTSNGVNVYTIAIDKQRKSLIRYVYEYAAFFVWAFVRTFFMARRKHYDVVDVNTLPDFLIFAGAPARWFGAKLVLDMHEITPEFYMSKYGVPENSLVIRIVKFLEKISFKYADYVVTINEPILNLLIKRGLQPSKAIVVMNAVSEQRFASILRAQTGNPDSDKFVMMYHGTLTPIYGLDLAIRALNLVRSEIPGAELWILGTGSEQQKLTSLVQEYGLEAQVKLFGLVPSTDIPKWLDQCDAGILPLRGDVFLNFAFPNKLPEFIIMGKPVLMSRLNAIRYYFSEDALAFFEPNNAEDLARQMVRLYRDRPLRAQLAATAKQEYVPIRWDVSKQRYMELIKGMVSAQPPVATRPRSRETTVLKG